MAHETVHCYQCEGVITDDEYQVVSVGNDHVFFHTDCYQHWVEEQQAEQNRQLELWEFFG